MKSEAISPQEYRQWMDHLQRLPVYALVTTGRTGSDFLQSLLDSHPEVLTFNGHFAVYTEFFRAVPSLKARPASVNDIMDEFVRRYLYKLVSRYDVQEGKDRLGTHGNESFTIDTAQFGAQVAGLMGGQEVSSRNLLLAIYGAYNLCLGQDLPKKKIVFHHPHLFYEFREFLADFPDAGVVVTTRDPRANFVSHVEHFRRFDIKHDNEQHLFHCLKMMLEDSSPLEGSGLRYTAIRLEDLPKESTMIKLSEWLGITYSVSLLRSTWAGLDWHGDRLSTKTFESTGWSETRTDNKWRYRLGKMEQYVFNFLMKARLQHYQYAWNPTGWRDALIVAFLILLPMKHERRFFSPAYHWGIVKQRRGDLYLQAALTPYFYVKRVTLCYGHFWKAVRGGAFNGPWIR